jgi:hypothetical protein
MIKETIEHIVKEPFYIGDKQVYSYIFYQDLSQYAFYNKNGWVIATITSEEELDSEEDIAMLFGEEAPKKREELMW